MKKIILSIAIISFFSLEVFTQQLTSFTQYQENKYMINPAVAGTTPYSPLTFGYRKLWTGINNSPTMQIMNSHLLIADNMGVGAKLFNYSTGPLDKTGIEGTYAYQITINTDLTLSMGLSGQLYQFHLNKSNIVMEDMNDDVLITGAEKVIIPDAAFGTYLYSNNYYVGLSVFQLFNRNVSLFSNGGLENKQIRHYFFTAGYKIDINNNWAFEPSTLFKFIESGIYQADINAKTTFKETVSLSLSYRTQEAIGVAVGFNKDKMFIGYAYDILLSDIRKHSLGSHELLFIYKFSKSTSIL